MTHRPPDGGPRDYTIIDTRTDRISAPGDLLASWLVWAGAAVARIHAKVGRSANNFWSGWESDHDAVIATLQAWKPDLVFIFLGTNDAGLNMTVDGQKMDMIRKAFADAGAEVWAIGAPSFPVSGRGSTTSDGKLLNEEVEKVYTMQRRVFGPDRVIDTRPLTADILTWAQGREGDGIHFRSIGAQTFAVRLAAALGAPAGRIIKAAKDWIEEYGIDLMSDPYLTDTAAQQASQRATRNTKMVVASVGILGALVVVAYATTR